MKTAPQRPSKSLLKSVKIMDGRSRFNGEVMDVLVVEGMIERIDSAILTEDALTIQIAGACISPSWVDTHANFGEPGLETKETLETGKLAALQGGFGTVAVMPHTLPALHSKAEISALIGDRRRGGPVKLWPIGALSHDRAGKNLAELQDMWVAGAIGFTDGNHPVSDAGFMTRAMQYVAGFGGLVISFPEEPTLSGQSGVNESVQSSLLGMKGSPALAEELMIGRDLQLAKYTGVRIHFDCISTAGAVAMIRQAKKEALPVTASVAAHQLLLTDQRLSDFDSMYKVQPPLREPSDIEALINGLKDDTIDAICSQHTPHEEELKQLEFENAASGIIGLETCFSVACMAMPGQTALIARKLSEGPRAIFRLPPVTIAEGALAELTLFDPVRAWAFTRNDIRSTSINTPFLGETLTGMPLGVISGEWLCLIERNNR